MTIDRNRRRFLRATAILPIARSLGCVTFGAASVAFAGSPTTYAADGVVIGSNDLGPLSGSGARTIALADAPAFLRRARLAQPAATAPNKALAHILRVEADIVQARGHLVAERAFETEFPANGF